MIVFIYAGQGKIIAGDTSIDIKRGESVLVLAGQEVVLRSIGDRLDCYSVSAPTDKN
jgi:mannose-6-phosphate isomerase-like protein (cupin superfamily)